MDAGLHQAGLPVPGLGRPLLDARLRVPPPGPGAVSRGGLIETARSSGCRLVAVTAPAGYGKSVFLAEWAAAETRRVAWVCVGRFDDDPAVLVALLAAAVAGRTEGWPAGLCLAALMERQDRGRARAIAGDDRDVADYLYREVLAGQPEAVQRFLRRTAVLGRLSGPLCAAVLGSPAAAARLRRAEADGLFVIALDRRRQWYRYPGAAHDVDLGRHVRPEASPVPGTTRGFMS